MFQPVSGHRPAASTGQRQKKLLEGGAAPRGTATALDWTNAQASSVIEQALAQTNASIKLGAKRHDDM